MDADQLRRYLEFYQDLGIKTLYRSTPPSRACRPNPPSSRTCPPLAPQPATSLLKIIRRHRRLPPLPPARRPQQDRLRRRQRASAAGLRGRRSGRRRRRAGHPVRRPRRPVAHADDRRHRQEGRHPAPARRRLHLQRGEVPPARQPHARARRNGNLRPVPLPPALRHPSQGHLRARRHRRARLTGHKEGVTKMRGKWFKWQRHSR